MKETSWSMQKMQIDVISYDSDQGSIALELDDSAKEFLIEKGFNTLLREALEKTIEENNERKTD